MADDPSYTLFFGARRLAQGDLQTVAEAAYEADSLEGAAPVVLSDLTGRVVDLDLRGSLADVTARYATAAPPPLKASRGRPKLGVVAREVTLLPRHWDWLTAQQGGASAALRRLVDQARRDGADSGRRREVQEATHRVMTTLGGDLPHYEDALRAFYANDAARFEELTSAWPADIGDYVRSRASLVWTSAD
jgi:hypothetical protein